MKNCSPKVSVIIPCYNQGQYLDEAVDSVINQTFKDFEIIIINDGSTDQFTIKKLKNYTKPKCCVIHSDNQGPSIARNIAIKRSTGEYILPLDADDRIGPNYLEEAVKILDNHNKIGIVYCDAELFGDGNGRTGRILNSLYLVQQNLLSSPVIYLSSYIIDNKQDYYRLLHEVTEKQNWRDWIMFMTTAVNETAILTIQIIREIIRLKKEMEEKTMQVLEKFNKRHELYDLMFAIPYLKIELVVKKGIAHRQTAAVYLKELAANSMLKPIKLGKTTYYVNYKLLDLITQR